MTQRDLVREKQIAQYIDRMMLTEQEQRSVAFPNVQFNESDIGCKTTGKTVPHFQKKFKLRHCHLSNRMALHIRIHSVVFDFFFVSREFFQRTVLI